MPSATYTLFRNAIVGEQQVVCSYDGRLREFCPHIIGTNRSGEEVVLVKFRVPSDRPRGRFLRKPDMWRTHKSQKCRYC
jgi:hypothetical protein